MMRAHQCVLKLQLLNESGFDKDFIQFPFSARDGLFGALCGRAGRYDLESISRFSEQNHLDFD